MQISAISRFKLRWRRERWECMRASVNIVKLLNAMFALSVYHSKQHFAALSTRTSCSSPATTAASQERNNFYSLLSLLLLTFCTYFMCSFPQHANNQVGCRGRDDDDYDNLRLWDWELSAAFSSQHKVNCAKKIIICKWSARLSSRVDNFSMIICIFHLSHQFSSPLSRPTSVGLFNLTLCIEFLFCN
jgi:hypothetical protein